MLRREEGLHSSKNLLVQQGCCPCSSGGRLIAITKIQEESYYKQLGNKCRNSQRKCMTVFYCKDWEEQCQVSACSGRVLQQIQKYN